MSEQLTNAGRKVRSREQWLRYDSIVIGEGARDASPSWYNTFAEFAEADALNWFTGSRTRQVGLSYSNIAGDTEDFAQMIYQSGIEFIAPLGALNAASQGLENVGVLQNLFVNELPKRMAFTVRMMDTDDVLIAPGIHMPGGVGNSGQTGFIQSAISFSAGQTGTPEVRNTWSWPEPLEVPARSKISLSARIDRPTRTLLQQFDTLPGTQVYPVEDANGEFRFVEQPNWYVIRVWHRGPRFVQLRGARTAF